MMLFDPDLIPAIEIVSNVTLISPTGPKYPAQSGHRFHPDHDAVSCRDPYIQGSSWAPLNVPDVHQTTGL